MGQRVGQLAQGPDPGKMRQSLALAVEFQLRLLALVDVHRNAAHEDRSAGRVKLHPATPGYPDHHSIRWQHPVFARKIAATIH